ncbi:MAG TPA: DUF2461 domain-containing protein [Candidatus Limnocylindria bacterium]|jgi:uncharacterized protein (TIGR02453 family)|nr:DUF2461 domain-containing protein [Candidatus Limnocylindria bacterium]
MPSRPSDPLDLEVTFRFLRGLARTNDRAWFHANRAPWDEHIRHAWEDLVTMLLLAGAQSDPRLAHVDPRTCVFRLANDTRFHAGKVPYKTHLAAWLSPGGKNGAYPGYYFHLAPGRSHVAAGVYVPTKPALHALRTTFADDGADARAFDRLLGAKALRPYLPLETAALRVTPRGFPKSHPRLALIRARNYMVERTLEDAELRAHGAFALFRGVIRDTAPFVRWLDAHLGRPEQRDDDAWDEAEGF